MTATPNPALLLAAVLSGVAALLHLAIIAGGPAWYRFFGAGERMARAAERGHWQPTVITLAIAAVLALWAGYALSAAGVIPRWPLLRPALLVITVIYLLRGLLFIPVLQFNGQSWGAFAIWSSLICLLFGGAHLLGLWQMWDRL